MGETKKPFEAQVIDGDASDLDSLIGYNMKRAYMIIQNDFRRIMKEDGFSASLFSALALVVQYPQISQSKLARMLGMERSGLVAIIDDLEKRGYVARATVPGDRRVYALAPLEAGLAAYREALAKIKAHEDKLLGALSKGEQQILVELLRKIRDIEVEK